MMENKMSFSNCEWSNKCPELILIVCPTVSLNKQFYQKMLKKGFVKIYLDKTEVDQEVELKF